VTVGLRILVVEDHPLIRDGLTALLSSRSDHEVVADVGDGRSAVEQATQHEPHIVVMDVILPELNGIEAARQIIAARPQTAVIMLSMYREPQYIEAALEAGAAAYLVKDCMSAELLDVIDAVGRGERMLVRGADDVVQGADAHPSLFERLSPREREVLQLYAEGQGTKEIAFDLGVSPKTVETHRARIYQKLGCQSVADLTRAAIREGLIEA